MSFSSPCAAGASARELSKADSEPFSSVYVIYCPGTGQRLPYSVHMLVATFS